MKQVGTAAIRRVVKQSVPATVTYGAAVVGCTNPSLIAAKRAVGQTVGPHVRGKCLNLALYLSGMDVEINLLRPRSLDGIKNGGQHM